MEVKDKDLFVAGVLALVIFEVWKIYENNAPSLAICRAAESTQEKSDVRIQLADCEVVIGGGVLLVAGTFAYHTKEAKIIILPVLVLAGLSLYRQLLVDSHSTYSPR